MSVEIVSSELAIKREQWGRVRHAVAGGDALRNPSVAGEYIPRLSEQSSSEYKSYVGRPVYFEATARTRDAMTGLVFQKAPMLEFPVGMEDLLLDIDADGTTIDEFVSHVIDDQQETGFGAIVVEHNGDPANPGTADSPSGRPFLKYYPAESVLGYKYRTRNGSRSLAQLRLFECVEVAIPGDEFGSSEVEQVRVLDIDAAGNYRQRIYREAQPDAKTAKKNKPKWEQFGPEVTPLRNGAPIDFVPARVVSANGRRTPGNAPLAPIAEMNLSHWRTLADYEHALHFCGLPTPYVSGVQSPTVRRGDIGAAIDGETGSENLRARLSQGKQPSIKLGSSQIITFSDPNAQMRYLQLDVTGIGALDKALDRKEAAMSVLGARMLAKQSAGVESAEALTIKRSGETSALAKLATAVSLAVTDALNMLAEWAGFERGSVSYVLNTEFVTDKLDAPMLMALLSSVNAGKYSVDSFIFKMKANGFVPEDITVDDEKERIANGPQPLATPMFSGFN